MAEEERVFFERLWNKKLTRDQRPDPQSPTSLLPTVPQVPLKTRTLSQLREFFLSRKSIATFAIFGLIAAAITYGFYRHNLSLNTKRIQEKVLGIAATGALQFNPADLDQLRTLKDIEKPEYKKVIYQLNEIRRQNQGVKYICIMRPTKDVNTWEFVADADSLQSTSIGGENYPGQPYDVRGSNPPVNRALNEPVYFAPFIDPWGTLISAWAPIKTANAISPTILGVDVDVAEVQNLSRASFAPVSFFIFLFIIFTFVRLAAFNKSLFYELLKLLRERKAILIMLFVTTLVIGIIFALYQYTLNIMKHEVGTRLMSIAATAASEFDANDLAQLKKADDLETEAYQRVFKSLNEIRTNNKDIKYSYIFRPTNNSEIWEFVADADSNFFIPFEGALDNNNDGKLDAADESIVPGQIYDAKNLTPIAFKYSLTRPTYEEQHIPDQWGRFLSGYAPVRDTKGKTVAVLGLDMDISDLYELTMKRLVLSQ